MRTIRRALAAAAAPLLLAGLVACGSPEEPTATEETPAAETTEEETGADEEETTEEETPSDEETDEDSDEESDEGTPSEEEPTDGEDEGEGDAPGTTSVEHVWVDDSWTVEEVADLCGDMEPSPAPYSDQEGFFTCGPTAASALACQVEAENLVVCITNATSRSAISFASDAAVSAGSLPANEDALPIQATLPGGVTCEPLAHDHDQHYNEMFSWYACDDGSELLTDEEISHTFAVDGDAWTVLHSVDKGEPELVVAETVTFAGTD